MQDLQRGNGRTAPAKTAKEDSLVHKPQVHQVCPYFALLDDPDTSLLFPSAMAHCHQTKPPGPVRLGYQESHCLTHLHTSCPLFAREQPGPMPPEIKGQAAYVQQRNGIAGRIAGGLVLLLLAMAIILWVGGFIVNGREGTPAPTLAAAAPVPVATATPTQLASEPSPSTDAGAVAESAAPTTTAVPAETGIPTDTPAPLPTETAVVPTPLPPTFTPVPLPPSVLAVQVPINVRTGPHNSYPTVELVSDEGAEFDLVGQLESEEWLQICCFDGAAGWVAAEAVNIEGSASNVPFVSIPDPQLVITATRLNVRRGPGIAYPVITTADAGTIFDLVGGLNDSSWWQICCLGNGATGWVFSEGVGVWGYKDIVPIAVPPPLPTATAES